MAPRAPGPATRAAAGAALTRRRGRAQACGGELRVVVAIGGGAEGDAQAAALYLHAERAGGTGGARGAGGAGGGRAWVLGENVHLSDAGEGRGVAGAVAAGAAWGGWGRWPGWSDSDEGGARRAVLWLDARDWWLGREALSVTSRPRRPRKRGGCTCAARRA